MRCLPLLCLAILLCCLTKAGAQEKWLTYTNARFGFSLKYPPDWKLQPSGQNGAGATLQSPDGRITMLAQAHFLAVPLGDFIGIYRAQFPDHTIKVRERKDGFILQAQGKETESIVQFRTSGGNWASLEVTLPREMHSPEVDDIYKSWQPFLKGNYDRVP